MKDLNEFIQTVICSLDFLPTGISTVNTTQCLLHFIIFIYENIKEGSKVVVDFNHQFKKYPTCRTLPRKGGNFEKKSTKESVYRFENIYLSKTLSFVISILYLKIIHKLLLCMHY
jgi:hypothetical protein